MAQRLRERNIKHVILYYYSYATDLLINYADQLGIVIDYIVEDVKEPRRIPRLPYNTVNYPNCDAIINCNIRYPKLSKKKARRKDKQLNNKCRRYSGFERVFVKDYGRKQHKMYKYEFMYSMWGM